MEQKPLKQIFILMKNDDSWLFDKQQKVINFHYNPSFDPWDNLAAARYLYQIINKTQITTDTQYVDMMATPEFKKIVKQINQSRVVESSERHKVFLVSQFIVDQEHFIAIKESQIVFSVDDSSKELIVKYIINKEQDQKTNNHYCILDTWKKGSDVIYELQKGLFQGLLQGQDELWTTYKVFEQELPTDDELKNIKGLVITGSPSTAYIQEEWYEKFYAFLNKINHLQKRVFGSCFGHQALAQALDGEVTRMPLESVYGVREVQSVGEVQQKKLNVYVHHGDWVTKLPRNTQSFLKSDYCDFYAFQNEFMLGTQFHPEFNNVFIHFIMKVMDQNISEEQKLEIKSETMQDNQDCFTVQRICIDFLKKGTSVIFNQA